MSRAYRGPYAAQSSYEPPYATAAVWGTGIDPIHGYYGEGPPLRTLGRSDTLGSSPVATQYPRGRDYQNPADSSGLNPPEELTWGYPTDDYGPDSVGAGADAPVSTHDIGPPTFQYMNGRPAWNTPPEAQRLRRDSSTMPPWNRNGNMMRALRAGSHRLRIYPNGPISAEPSDSNPTETVSEGWLNKVTSFVAYAKPSSTAQLEVQTSMRQRFGVRDNMRAQERCTDDPRSTINSRVEAMVEKVYSTGERTYDMFPYQQDQINRPFRNRTAGVGRADWMETNAFSPVQPWQRTPPPDPSMGVTEVPDAEAYGYTGEDTMYFG
jgi:hypothetical protein